MKKALIGTRGIISIILTVLMIVGVVYACHLELKMVEVMPDYLTIKWKEIGFVGESKDFVLIIRENSVDAQGNVELDDNPFQLIIEEPPGPDDWYNYTFLGRIKSAPDFYSVTVQSRKFNDAGDLVVYQSKTIEIKAYITGVDPSQQQPEKIQLYQNYPNPFNPQTVIKYNLPHSGHVKLTICDILGREIAVLIDQPQNKGNYEATWNASDQPGGVYFYRLQASEFVEMKKMTLMK